GKDWSMPPGSFCRCVSLFSRPAMRRRGRLGGCWEEDVLGSVLISACASYLWWLLYCGQHMAQKRKQLLGRVKAHHLARDHMLDATFPGQRCLYGLGTKLDDEGPIGWERWLRHIWTP